MLLVINPNEGPNGNNAVNLSTMERLSDGEDGNLQATSSALMYEIENLTVESVATLLRAGTTAIYRNWRIMN